MKFKHDKVKTIIEAVLNSHLTGVQYNPESCKELVLNLSEVIKKGVKELNYQRYKMVCMVSIGELKDQGMLMGSRCCWDPKLDTFTTGSFKNDTLFAIGSVWGIYFE